VSNTERSVENPSSRTGLLATLRASLGARWSGAPAHRREALALVAPPAAPARSSAAPNAAEGAQDGAGQGRREAACSARDRTRTPACAVLSGALALLLVCLLAPSAALASSAHAFSHAFGAPGAGAGQLALAPVIYEEGNGARSGGSGLAVNAETGDVYVADTENHRVVEFTAAGTFIRAFGADVGGPGVDVCTAGCLAGSAASSPGAFEKPTFIVVDNAPGGEGDLYVGDLGDQTITKLDSEGNLIASWGSGGQLKEAATSATGSGDIPANLATGSGDVNARSTSITSVSTESGAFEVGQGIEGQGIQFATYITAVGTGTLTLSRPAGFESHPGAHLTTRRNFVTGLSVSAGAFLLGQEISGPGIPAGTEIIEAGPGALELSQDASAGASGLALAASATVPLALSGLAVDSTGRLWADNTANVFAFARAGAFATGFTPHIEGYVSQGFNPRPFGLALDSAGNLYFVGGFDEVMKFDSGGETLGVLTRLPLQNGGVPVTGLALDSAGDDPYVDLGSQVAHLAPSCTPDPEPNGGNTCPPTESFGSAQLEASSQGSGLAVDPTDHTVYAADSAAAKVYAYADVLDAETEAAGEEEATSATLNGTVNPRGAAITACSFEYGTTTAYGKSMPCEDPGAGEISGSSPVPVHAGLTRLKPNATYHFRLVLSSAQVPSLKAEDLTFQTKPEAAIEAAAATEVTDTTALLTATVNPKGVPVTSCSFEYDTAPYAPEEAPHGTAVPCEPTPGSGTFGIPVSHSIEGLSPNTTYHFRVVVADANGTATSPDHTFVFLSGPLGLQHGCANEALRGENSSLALPDCRAYEQVTPTHKNGALIGAVFFGLLSQVAADGERVIAPSIQCFGGSPSCIATRQNEGAPFAFERSEAGWKTNPLALPASQFTTSTSWLYSAATGAALYSSPTAPAGEDDFYGRSLDGAVTHIGPLGPPEAGARGVTNVAGTFDTATANLSHLLYEPEFTTGGAASRWPFDLGNGPSSVYEYAAPASQPLLVGVSGGRESTALVSRCGTEIGADLKSSSHFQALSADGRVVYFTAAKCLAAQNGGTKLPADTVYARVDGELEDAHTVAISNPTPSECGSGPAAEEEACGKAPPAAGFFAGASQDGQLAYFASTRQLTDQASQDSTASDTASGEGCSQTTGQNGCNLYLYDLGAEAGHHLTAVSAGDTSGEGPRFQGMLALSADGNRAYFLAKGALAANPGAALDVETGEAQRAEAGSNNLYLYDADEEKVSFIATLPAADSVEWASQEGALTTANVSPDGSHLVFESHAGLTPDATRPESPTQVYRYDAQSGQLVRLSIGARGFGDDGNSTEVDANILRASRAMALAPVPARRDPTMSDNGRFVFFTSPAALTPGALDNAPIDTKGDLAENLYEWEADGAGGCAEARGCVQLISDGRDTTESGTISSVGLLGTDAEGKNVFFSTASRLTPADTDTQRDYYDARIGGGFPRPASGPICETSDGCHTQGTTPGPPQTHGTAAFNGPGNVHETKCRKGFVKRHGKCVKKHHKRRHHHKRAASHKRGGHK
jgi:hypothetical protein